MNFLRIFRNQPLSDAELLVRCKKTGSADLLAELFNRHLPIIHGICLKYLDEREDARDACMEVFDRLLTEVSKHEIQNFRSWVCSVTVRFCLMSIRSRKRRGAKHAAFVKELQTDMEFVQTRHLTDRSDAEPMYEKLDFAMLELRQEQRACIELFYFHKKSYAEIASYLEIEINEVKSHLQNGKRNLKQLLERNED